HARQPGKRRQYRGLPEGRECDAGSGVGVKPRLAEVVKSRILKKNDAGGNDSSRVFLGWLFSLEEMVANGLRVRLLIFKLAASTRELKQQSSAARFHCWRAGTISRMQNLPHLGSNGWVVLCQVSKSLEREGLHNGAMVFEIALE
ncbi:MAG: hypothetical protein WAN38_09590, partial [Terriglobales bacterium]